MLRKALALFLIFCLLSPLAALATEDDQEVSITLFDADGNDITNGQTGSTGEDGSQDAAVEDSTATALADRAAPVYEPDGSIVLKLTFTGDFTIGENVQYNGQSLFDKELAKHDGDANLFFRITRIFWKTTTGR